MGTGETWGLNKGEKGAGKEAVGDVTSKPLKALPLDRRENGGF